MASDIALFNQFALRFDKFMIDEQDVYLSNVISRSALFTDKWAHLRSIKQARGPDLLNDWPPHEWKLYTELRRLVFEEFKAEFDV